MMKITMYVNCLVMEKTQRHSNFTKQIYNSSKYDKDQKIGIHRKVSLMKVLCRFMYPSLSLAVCLSSVPLYW